MPKVPIYQRQVGAKAAPTPYENQAHTPDAYGAAIGQGLQTVGEGAQRVAKQAEEKQNAARVMDAYAKLGEWQNQQLFEPKQGALTKKGETAIGISDTYVQSFDQFAGKLEGGLQNDQQRQAFSKLRNQERETVQRTLMRHEDGQLNAVAAASADAALSTSISNAANNAGDRQARDDARALGEQALMVRGQSEGWPAHVLQAKLADYRTKFHVAVMDRLVTASPSAAAKYLEKYGPDIDGAERTKLERVLVEQRAEDTAVALAPRGEFGRVDEAKALTEVEKLPPEQRKKVRTLVEERIQEGKGIYKAEVEKHFTPAFSQYLEKGLRGVDPELRKWLIKNAPDKWDDLVDDAYQKMFQLRSTDAETRRDQKERDASALKEFQSLDDAVISQTPVEAFSVGRALSPGGVSDLRKEQKSASKRKETGIDRDRSAFLNELVTDAGNRAKKPEEKRDLRAVGADEFQKFAAKNGRAPNTDEAAALKASLLKNRIEPGIIFDSNKGPEYKGRAKELREKQAAGETPAGGFGGRPIDTGRPIIHNPDGSFSTERTITVEADGAHFVIPSIVGGKQRSEREAVRLWQQGQNPEVGRFHTAKEADTYAKQRTQEIGRVRGGDAAAPAPKAVNSAKDIDPAEVRQIVDAYQKRHGSSPGEAEILQRYRQHHGIR